jgi:hypothetical protein
MAAERFWENINMKRTRSFVAIVSAVLFGGTLSRVRGQAQSQSIEQQLRKQYVLTRVGANGVVLQAGTVLTVQADGIKANPASYVVFWPNIYKKDAGRVTQRLMTVKAGTSKARAEVRFLQVGEKVYLAGLQFRNADAVFLLQTCGACSQSGADPNDIPYRAEVVFQLGKGYRDGGDFKQVQDTIGQVFGIDASQEIRKPPPVVPLKLPSTYVSAQVQTDQLQLNADNTLSLQEAGQTYRGTFVQNGSTLELNINDGPKTTATIEGNNLTDSSGKIWVPGGQPAQPASGASVLQNQDIIKMVKASFDDATIIAKIGSSKCQFDTSTDALIQLKEAGVSAAVLQAMVGAGK